MNATDTSHCPRGHRCEACGVERDDLRVEVVVFARLGAGCMTLCPPCADSDVDPPVTASTAARFVQQHGWHLRRAAVAADDALIERLRRGETPPGDPTALALAAWRAEAQHRPED